MDSLQGGTGSCQLVWVRMAVTIAPMSRVAEIPCKKYLATLNSQRGMEMRNVSRARMARTRVIMAGG